ncbi:MAG: hypothetical protein QOK06_3241, partial [Acidimicrobiaceae bacterium]
MPFEVPAFEMSTTGFHPISIDAPGDYESAQDYECARLRVRKITRAPDHESA